MKVVTFNANGIRSAASKGFFGWLERQNADVVCIQETKAQEHQLTDAIFCPEGYHCYYNDAVKPGYSGTAVYSKVAPDNVSYSFGSTIADQEGRFIQVDYPGISVVSWYMPSGSSSDERQLIKYQLMDELMAYMQHVRGNGREYLFCADWNICHKEIDLKNWKGNLKNSGFLPDERAWLDRLFDEVGYVDVFRRLNQLPEQYTWWSNRGQARAKNVGWRLDYQVVTPRLAETATGASIYTDERFSDHAPFIMEYDLTQLG